MAVGQKQCGRSGQAAASGQARNRRTHAGPGPYPAQDGATNATKLYALYALAVTTEARQGELLALQHGDVDLDTGTIGINRSVYNGVVSDPKTASSRRTIRLSKLALEALRDHLNTYVGTYGYSPRPKTPPH